MNQDQLQAMRREYSLHELDEAKVAADPILQFESWLQEAVTCGLPEPNAMTLATVNHAGQPSTRVVLLKEIRNGGFVFYTNYESRKGKELSEHPLVSLHFLWMEMERQVRIEGVASKLVGADSAAYFASRPRESQIGAWSSRQSEPIQSRVILEHRYQELEEKYADIPSLPMPPYWGGYFVRPTELEFWQGRASRLHDRVQYTLEDNNWVIVRLQP